jgi:Xaa-Pro aminopeptidase
MDRRNMIMGTAGLGLGLVAEGGARAAPGAACAADQSTADAPARGSTRYDYPGVDGKLLVNKPRAYAVLEEMKLDGLIALNPVNVYYLSNTVPIMTRFLTDIPALATFARDPKEPSFLITSSAQGWDLVNGYREVPEFIAVTGVRNWQDYVDAGPAQMKIEPQAAVAGYAIKKGAALLPREQRWADIQHASVTSAAPSPAWGLVKALKQSGLEHGRIGVDDMRIKLMLDEIGFTSVTCVPASNTFRKIRVIKSEPELALMRVAGANNALAAMNTIKSIRGGMRFVEIERRFQEECAALGSAMTSFVAGMSSGLFPDGLVVPGKPFLVDGVSQFRQYNGDFGRTVCVGDPPKDVLARARANKIGRDEVFAAIKPGLRFSDLHRIALEAEVKAGMPREIIIASAHSVGLEHGDHPTRLDYPYAPPIDTVLEENMVLTMDLPYMEVGWGAGHHEDLIRVTKTGYEPMHPEGDPLIVV